MLLNTKCTNMFGFSVQRLYETFLILRIIQRDMIKIVHWSSCKVPVRGRDSSVGIATRYGLDGPWIESRWGARFSAPVQTGPGAHPASNTMGAGSFRGAKATGAWRGPTTSSSAEVKERVGLYLYSPSGPSWPVLG
jgi:hypothetical protein